MSNDNIITMTEEILLSFSFNPLSTLHRTVVTYIHDLNTSSTNVHSYK